MTPPLPLPLPFSKASVSLQQFLSAHPEITHEAPSVSVSSNSTNGSQHKHHAPLIEFIRQETVEWKRSFNGTKTTQRCPSFRSHTKLRTPTKLYVLNRLLVGQDEASTCAYNALMHRSHLTQQQHSAFQKMYSQMLHAQTPSHKTWQWFHVNVNEQMLALGEREMMLLLDNIDDESIRYALKLWRHFPDLFDYFVPLNVQYKYEKQLHCSTLHQWTWKQYTYELEIFSPSQCIDQNVLHHICYRITMMSRLGSHKCTHLRLKWFPSNCTKEIGQSLHHACCNHHSNTDAKQVMVWNPYQINTGATYRNTCNSVTIWRREEAAKTFLHEMMHGYGWDFDAPDRVQDWVHDHFAIDPNVEIRFYEAYVETWATLLNVYMSVLFHAPNRSASAKTSRHQKKKKTNRKTKKKEKTNRKTNPNKKKKQTNKTHQINNAIQQLLCIEKQFVMFQVAKLLVHSGFENWQCFFTRNTIQHQPHQPSFHQTTSVFSYFIIRSAHLWDVAWFIRQFSHTPDFKTHRTDSLFDAWLHHLEDVFCSSTYVNTVNAWMQWIQKQCKSTQHDTTSFVLDNMRMTCVETI